MNSGGNLQRTSARGFEPPFVEGKGAWGWLSPDTMRCVGAIDVVCAKQSFDGLRPTSGPPRYWRKKFESKKGRTRALGQLVETVSFSRTGHQWKSAGGWRETRPTAAGRDVDRQGRRGGKGILESLAAREGYAGLFVAGEDGVGIAQAPL